MRPPGRDFETQSVWTISILSFRSQRSAVFAIQDRRVEHIADGLAAIAIIQANRIDYRDAFVALGLLDHAARAIGETPDELFVKAALLAEPTMSEIILGVLAPGK